MKPEIFRSEINCKPEWQQQWVLVIPCQSSSVQSLPFRSSFSASCRTEHGSATQQCRAPSSNAGAGVTRAAFWKTGGGLAAVHRDELEGTLSHTFYLVKVLSADEREAGAGGCRPRWLGTGAPPAEPRAAPSAAASGGAPPGTRRVVPCTHCGTNGQRLVLHRQLWAWEN